MASTISCDVHVVVSLNLIPWSLAFFPPAILLSPSLLLTARLEEGSQVQIFPLQGKPTNKGNSFLPSLRDAQEAGYIRLREISKGPTKSAQVDTPDSGKRRDWLAILLREHLGKCYTDYHVVACMLTHFNLVGLKFITTSQIVEVLYESRPRRFFIDSVSVRPPGAGDLVSSITEEVKSLSFHSQHPLWTTGWDTSVCILGNHTDHKVDYPHKVGCCGTLRTWNPEC